MTDPLPDVSPFLDQRRFVSIAHQVPGRIRLKLDLAGLAHLRMVDPEPFLQLVRRIRGIKSTRVNIAALSVVIDYDAQLIPDGLWHRLLVGDRAEVETILAHSLA